MNDYSEEEGANARESVEKASYEGDPAVSAQKQYNGETGISGRRGIA